MAKKNLPIEVYPGQRSSDVTPTEIPKASHQEVQNSYINKKGEWQKMPDFIKVTPIELVYKTGTGTTGTIGHIQAAIEYEEWLIVFTSLGKFFRVQIVDDEYVAGPFDESGTDYCSLINTLLMFY